MKSLAISALVAISVVAIAHRADADPHKPDFKSASNQAATLTPVAVGISRQPESDQAMKLNQIAQSIPSANSQKPQPIDPLDLLNSPEATWKRLTQDPPQPNARPIAPLDLFKIPSLDSGVSITINHF